MPRPLIITLKEGVDRVSGLQRTLASAIKASEGQYLLMQRMPTYAQGVHALRNDCIAVNNPIHPQYTLSDGSKIYRPLTFKETIEGRVNDYESHKDTEERLLLFQRWNDSCTGIAYKARTKKFKIIHECQNFITVPEGFNQHFLPITYDLLGSIELQSDRGKYNQHLTKNEVVHHQAWLTAVENDAALLKAYSDIVFAELKQDAAMAFVVRQDTEQDELRALLVNNLFNNSNAYGNLDLDSDGSFLRVAPVGAPQAPRKK